jgi:Flp pilus assembly protein TadG
VIHSFQFGRQRQKGFALLLTCLTLVVLIGIAGLALDSGRMYIVRSELQGFTDSASLSAALELDGTAEGIVRAKQAVFQTSRTTQWDMQTKTVTGFTSVFARPTADIPNQPDPASWNTDPPNPMGYRFVQVVASAPVPLVFMRAFLSAQFKNAAEVTNVASSSVAAQIQVDSFDSGIFPYAVTEADLVAGQQYSIRYWGGENADAPALTILGGRQFQLIKIGDPAPLSALIPDESLLAERILQDSDPMSHTYMEYLAKASGNGRRVVGMPVIDGSGKVVTFDAFLLAKPSAEYIGPYIQGASHSAAGPGGHVVRLVQ